MTAISYKGSICTGHGCHPPRPNLGGSTNVFVNGKEVHREGDPWDVHCCDGKNCHSSVLESASSTIMANGLGVGRVGDPVACGSAVAEGSSNVFAGG